MQEIFQLLIDKLYHWFEQLVLLLPNLALSIVFTFLGFKLVKRFGRFAGKMLDKVSEQKLLNNLFVIVIRISLFAVVIFIALTILQLDRAVTSILAGVGILSLGLAFAFQDIATNFIAGILISFRRPVRINDLIEVNGIIGFTQEVNLRETIIRSPQGKKIIIPNKDIFQSALTNHTRAEKQRLDLEVGVSYGDDLEKVKRVVMEAIEALDNRTPDPVKVFFKEFGDSSINLLVFVWLNKPELPVFLEARSEAIMRIKKAFDENDITIPFPIRTLDFGIKGGEKLSEMNLMVAEKKFNG
ncbi:MAG: mechanosensitive ion channel family protein [Cryomorphaceae bacterium]|nr:mechanosensitive ion channel family protein [Cryomorphaceae bacterium]